MFLLQKPEPEAYVQPMEPIHALAHFDPFSTSVAAPTDGKAPEAASVPATKPEPLEFTAAISAITGAGKVYSESRLPPTPPTSFKRWRPEEAPAPPHDPHSYFPMSLIK